MANNHEEPESHGESSRLSPRTSHGYIKVTSKRPRDRAPTDRDMDHIKDNLQHRTPHSSRWVLEKVIRNSQNHQKHERILHLLTLIDENNNIQERMTVKIVGDEDPGRLRQEVRREVEPHKRLQALESKYIINFIANSWRPNERNPKLGYIYMEWAPFGDLLDLVMLMLGDTPAYHKQLPEPYVWHIFRALVEGLHAMHTGVVSEGGIPSSQVGQIKKGWTPLIDPDIKLENIALCAAQDDYYPAYKTAKRIDFGQVFEDSDLDGDVLLLTRKGPMGTDKIFPPEQVFNKDPENPWDPNPDKERYKHVPIGVHSEIYNVGLAICGLMQGSYKESPKKGESLRQPTYMHCYSHKLESLVEQCLAEDYRDRPSLRDLINGIEIGMKSWEGAYGSANVADPPEFMRFDRLREEQFPIGSVAPEEWSTLPRKRKSNEGRSASKKSKPNLEPRNLQDKSPTGATPARKDKGHVSKGPEVVFDENMRRLLGEKDKRPEATQDAQGKGKITNDLLNILGDIGDGREEAENAEAEEATRAEEARKVEEAKQAEEPRLPKRPTMEKFTFQEAENVGETEEAEEKELPKRPTMEKFTWQEEDQNSEISNVQKLQHEF